MFMMYLPLLLLLSAYKKSPQRGLDV